jgi:hypothetical protein
MPLRLLAGDGAFLNFEIGATFKHGAGDCRAFDLEIQPGLAATATATSACGRRVRLPFAGQSCLRVNHSRQHEKQGNCYKKFCPHSILLHRIYGFPLRIERLCWVSGEYYHDPRGCFLSPSFLRMISIFLSIFAPRNVRLSVGKLDVSSAA